MAYPPGKLITTNSHLPGFLVFLGLLGYMVSALYNPKTTPQILTPSSQLPIPSQYSKATHCGRIMYFTIHFITVSP